MSRVSTVIEIPDLSCLTVVNQGMTMKGMRLNMNDLPSWLNRQGGHRVELVDTGISFYTCNLVFDS